MYSIEPRHGFVSGRGWRTESVHVVPRRKLQEQVPQNRGEGGRGRDGGHGEVVEEQQQPTQWRRQFVARFSGIEVVGI